LFAFALKLKVTVVGEAVAVLVVGAHGGSVGLDGDTLSVGFTE